MLILFNVDLPFVSVHRSLRRDMLRLSSDEKKLAIRLGVGTLSSTQACESRERRITYRIRIVKFVRNVSVVKASVSVSVCECKSWR